MLHIVSETLSEPSVLQRLLSRIGQDQSLLLIEDAVFATRQGGLVSNLIEIETTRLKLFVLNEDLLVRGIALEELITGIKPVDYVGFVNLVSEHKQVQSW